MLMGAIVGLVTALVLMLVMSLKNGGRMKQLDAASASSPEAARAYIDKKFPPRGEAQSLQSAALLRQRWAALARLDDHTTIAAEVAALRGPEKITDFAKNVGYLALALVGPEPALAAQRLHDLVEAAHAGKRHGKSGRALLDRQAAVARALAGVGPVPDRKALAAFGSEHADMGVIEALSKRCQARLGELGQVRATA